ncbi:MAG: COX15/CtaA family protein [Acidobacteria bacterium]|nr:COX15/CtaA family protein [Acidobacteriota bacterium]
MLLKLNKLAIYAWGVLFYNIGVIVWGAYVRSSRSGDGCGSHWPDCNGEIIPTAPELKTIIEFTHRLTSGLALLMVVVLLVWSHRFFQKKHPARLGAKLSMLFMLLEAAVGAAIVLFSLVADNASIARAMFMSVHLVNTFLLLGTLTLTAWWASGGQMIRLGVKPLLTVGLLFSLIGVTLLGASGAVAALGDTLFPSQTLEQALKSDLSATAHFLIRLRILHPFIAVITVGFSIALVIFTLLQYQTSSWAKGFSLAYVGLSSLQIILGLINVYLLAPTWLQLVHLLVADLVWISLVLATANILIADWQTSLEPQAEYLRQKPISVT